MKLDRYVHRSEDIILLSQSDEIKVVQVLMDAISERREELRKKNEEHQRFCPEDLTEDTVGISGEIRGLNWVLGLPQRSRDFIKNIK